MITIADLDATEKFAEVIGRVALPGDRSRSGDQSTDQKPNLYDYS